MTGVKKGRGLRITEGEISEMRPEGKLRTKEGGEK